MSVEDFGIAFALLVQKQSKFEFIQYFDCNGIQKPEGEDPLGNKGNHQPLAGLTYRNKQPFTLTFSPRVSEKSKQEENMQTQTHREANCL